MGKINDSIEKKEERNQRRTAFALILPSFTHYNIFFIIPLIVLFIYSLYHNVPGGAMETTISLENYQEFLGDLVYLGILLRSIKLGLVVTVLAILFGYPLAYFMSRCSERAKSVCYVIVLMPLFTSVVVRTYGWMIILGRVGVINSILMKLGLIDMPLTLMYNFTGVAIALLEVLLSFMVLNIHSVLENIDKSLELAAQSLGASKLKSFFLITFPLSIPGIASGSILVFALTVASFVTPTLIGGPGFRIIPTIIFEKALASLNWPLGASIAFIFLIVMIILITGYSRVTTSEKWSTIK